MDIPWLHFGHSREILTMVVWHLCGFELVSADIAQGPQPTKTETETFFSSHLPPKANSQWIVIAILHPLPPLPPAPHPLKVQTPPGPPLRLIVPVLAIQVVVERMT